MIKSLSLGTSVFQLVGSKKRIPSDKTDLQVSRHRMRFAPVRSVDGSLPPSRTWRPTSCSPCATISIVVYRLGGMSTVTRNNGQGTLRSRTATTRMATSPSIVQRPEHRALSGRNLGIMIHQHFGYRMHYTWDGSFGNRSFERRFKSYESVSDFCKTIVNGTPEGLCGCTIARDGGIFRFLGTVSDLLYTKTGFYFMGGFP